MIFSISKRYSEWFQVVKQFNKFKYVLLFHQDKGALIYHFLYGVERKWVKKDDNQNERITDITATSNQITCCHNYFRFSYILFEYFKVIAGVAAMFLLLDIGVSTSYPTVFISALTGLNDENNPNEFLEMTAVQASWMGQ